MQHFQRLLIVVMPFLTCAFVACAAPPAPAPNSGPLAGSRSAASPAVALSPSPGIAAAPRAATATLAIGAPVPGQIVPSGSVHISVQYSGPALVAAASAAKLDDYHLHYFLDENTTQYVGALVPVPAGNPRIVHSAASEVTFDNVLAGSHTVTVVMSGSNHISVVPPLKAEVTFIAQ